EEKGWVGVWEDMCVSTWWRTGLHVGSADPTVTCVFRQNCILPCNVDPSSDTIIHWDHLTSGEHNVHSYYDTEDQLGRQDQQFKGRTSLFQDLISRGNGSLRLTGVKIQDEGRYSCYSNLPLLFLMCLLGWFAALIKVSIKLVENRIICSSEWIYPQPELSWSVNPPSELEINSPTMVHQTEEQLYSISSSLLVSDRLYDQTYSCTVSSSRNKKTASFCKSNISIIWNLWKKISFCLCVSFFSLFLVCRTQLLVRTNWDNIYIYIIKISFFTCFMFYMRFSATETKT
uniref:Ig-like domain-containing protein n=1 Tax=Poecilia latipinna TaxID=48699 RepID=A0A3B3USG9_9TELE